MQHAAHETYEGYERKVVTHDLLSVLNGGRGAHPGRARVLCKAAALSDLLYVSDRIKDLSGLSLAAGGHQICSG